MAKLKTNEQFIKECIEIHGNKYDYSETFYTGAHNVITIICPIHGSFQQKAYSHVRGCGCLECAGVKKLTTKEFIEKSQKVHGNKFDYSEVDYQGNKLKVKIKCKKCGHIFEQQAQSHMKGFGCPFCSNNNKSTTKEFIEKASKVHGDKFDYSEVNYQGNKVKVKIKCKKCGHIFQQTPNSHLNGIGCPKCGNKELVTTEDFIQKARKVHGTLYDYSQVSYEHSQKKISIICPKHGIFWQKPNSHLNGSGCPKCFGFEKLTIDEFIKRSRKVHGEKYDYSLVNYVNAHTKVNIICPVHGVFQQIPSSHWYLQQGCPICALSKQTSRGEKEVCAYIKSIYSGEVLENDKTQIGRMELDIFLPELRIGIEYNGSHWHKLKEERQPGCHAEKERRCKEANILLINVEERDWKNNRKSIENLLFTKIHTKNKVCNLRTFKN